MEIVRNELFPSFEKMIAGGQVEIVDENEFKRGAFYNRLAQVLGDRVRKYSDNYSSVIEARKDPLRVGDFEIFSAMVIVDSGRKQGRNIQEELCHFFELTTIPRKRAQRRATKNKLYNICYIFQIVDGMAHIAIALQPKNIGWKDFETKLVKIVLSRTNNDIEITIEDDGKGFDISAAKEKSKGLGLFSVRERLRHIGGKLEIKSKRGKGTHIILTAPLKIG